MSDAPIIYLDNAATTFPKPEAVYIAADTYYRTAGANAGRGQNPLAQHAARLVTTVRSKVARWIGAPRVDGVIFAPSATIALNQAILGSPLHSGDAVYVTPFDHNSVLRPVEFLRHTRGIDVEVIPIDALTLEVQLDRLAARFRTRPPALLAFPQVSNVCGLVLPVEDIARLARSANPEVIIIVDGAQGAGLYPLDLRHDMIDYLVVSGHKSLYGPYGAACLVLCSARRPAPILFGGTGTDSESLNMPSEIPSAYEAGSLNIWALAGLGAAIDWLEEVGRERVIRQTDDLTDLLVNGLRQTPGIHVYTPVPAQRAAIVSFTCVSISPQAFEAVLGASSIAVRAGLHCAPWAHRLLGTLAIGGAIRVSPGFFNTQADIEACLAIVRRASVA